MIPMSRKAKTGFIVAGIIAFLSIGGVLLAGFRARIVCSSSVLQGTSCR